MIAYLVGLFSGMTLPVQTSVNARLGQLLRSAWLASVISFVGGVLFTAVIMLLSGEGFSFPFAEIAKEPLWIWFGGCFGFILVCCNMVALPHLGSAQVVMICALGQVLSSMVIDSFGFFKMPVIPMTPAKIVGAFLVVFGVGLVSSVKEAGGNKDNSKNLWIYRLLALVGGISAGIQVGINGRLGIVTGNLFKATIISMMVGLISSIVLCLVIYISKGKAGLINGEKPDFKGKWWMFTGGFFALVAVASNVYLSNALGAGLAVVVSLIGQMTGGVLIDQFGFLMPAPKRVTGKKIIGIIVMIVGTALIRLVV